MSKGAKKVERTPIITILGHVDHGKTTILDKIRDTDVQSTEAGGITQSTSVFTIKPEQTKRELTFIDTPGHEAFDLMRSRGGEIADVVLLVVAADDGVQPQTEESIEVIKDSGSKPIVVVNKTDLPNTDVEKVKRELSQHEILVEGYGGDIPLVEVSGKTGENIESLLETIDLLIDVEGVVDRGELEEGVIGKGYVLESIKDEFKGNVSTVVLVQGGAESSNWVAYMSNEVILDRIKGFVSEEDTKIEELKAGYGGKIIGLSELLTLGEEVYILSDKDKKLATSLFESEEDKEDKEVKETVEGEGEPDLLSAIFDNREDTEEEGEELNVILKASSEGSLEAIKSKLENLDVDSYTVNIVNAEVGDIVMRDIDKAEITNSIILGFETEVDSNAEAAAREKGILLRTYEIIYKLIEEIDDALVAMSTPDETEEELGHADIKAIFTLSDGTKVLGGRVAEGKIKRGVKCYVVRGDEIVVEGKVDTLRHEKNTINEATKGADFGATLTVDVDEVEEGDQLYCYKVVKNQ